MAQERAPFISYVMIGGTRSMEPFIADLQRGAETIEEELLKRDIPVAIAVVRDHYSQREVDGGRFEPVPLLEINEPAHTIRELRKQLSRVKIGMNSDIAECYACGWVELAKKIIGIRHIQGDDSQLHVTFIADSVPHGVRVEQYHGHVFEDRGCDWGLTAKTAINLLLTHTDYFDFISCCDRKELKMKEKP